MKHKSLLLLTTGLCLAVLSAVLIWMVSTASDDESPPQNENLTPQQKRIGELVKKLNVDNPDERAYTAIELGGIGQEALPAIYQALKSKKENVRAGAISALGCVKPRSPEFFSMFLKATKDEKGDVQAIAFEELRWFDPSPKELIPALLEFLGTSRDDWVRAKSIYILEDIDAESPETIMALEIALKDRDKTVRIAAARALGKIGSEAKNASQGLISVLNDPVIDVVHEAAPCLAKVSSQYRDLAIEALINKLRSKVSVDRFAASEAVGSIGPTAATAVPALIELLTDDRTNKERAAEALGRIGPAAQQSVPHLLKLLEEDDPQNDAKFEAGWALQRIAPTDPQVTEAVNQSLCKFMNDPERADWQRRNAAYVLQRYGSNVKSALPALQKAIKDPSPTAHIAACEAYTKLGGDPRIVIPSLLHDLEQEDVREGIGYFPDTNGDAAEVLGSIGPPAKAAVPLLLATLKAKEYHLPGRIQVALALLHIDSQNQTNAALAALTDLIKGDYQKGAVDAAAALVEFRGTAVPILIEMLKDERRGRRKAAATALGTIGSQAKDAIPDLRRAFSDPRPSVRRAILEASGKIGPMECLDILTLGVKDTAWSVREKAVLLLGKCDMSSKDVRAALEVATQDKDQDVRDAANKALAGTRR